MKYDDILLALQTENNIKNKSPDKLPLNPSAQGWTGAAIRKFLASSLFDNENSLLSVLKEKLEKIKDHFDESVKIGENTVAYVFTELPVSGYEEGTLSILFDDDEYQVHINKGNETTCDWHRYVLAEYVIFNTFMNDVLSGNQVVPNATNAENSVKAQQDKDADNIHETYLGGVDVDYTNTGDDADKIQIKGLLKDNSQKGITKKVQIPLASSTKNGLMSSGDKANFNREGLLGLIGEATAVLDGFMSATDKSHLDNLLDILGFLTEEDEDDTVNTIHEIFEILENYPEGESIVQQLASKVSKINGVEPTDGEIWFIDLIVEGDYNQDTGEITLHYVTSENEPMYNDDTGILSFNY
jgi:hypothetical protein